MKILKLVVLAISLLPIRFRTASAEDDFWQWQRKTCYTQGTLRICNTVALTVYEDWMGPGTGTSLIGGMMGPGTSSPFPILPSAIGFFTRASIGFEPSAFTSPGGCDGGTPARWTTPGSNQIAFPTLAGYSLMTGEGAIDGDLHWPAVNECQAGDVFGWTWQGPLPTDLLLVWKGESEDGSVDFDCWENPNGGEDCLNPFAPVSTISTAPEPSTIALLLTGMVALALVTMRQRQSTRNPANSRDS